MMTHHRICTSILSSIAISLLLFFSLDSAAQTSRPTKAQQEKMRLKEIEDSIPWFRGVAVKFDLVGAVEKAVSSYGQLEVGARVNLKDRYFPTLELGLGSAEEDNEVTSIYYKTSAPYFKVGCDFNILKNRHDIYRVFAGARVATTSFKFDIYHPDVTDPIWGGETAFSGTDVEASCTWAELLGGVEAKIWGPLKLGWSVRYKRRLKHDDSTFGNVWYVPGYGKKGSSHIDATFDIIVQVW